jgi:hypothetical protein
MPFHLGGRKPRPPARVFRFGLKERLKVAAIGLFLPLLGLYRDTHVRFGGRNGSYHPAYSIDLIAVGVLVTLCALLPSSWVENASKRIAAWLLRTPN